MVKIGVHLGQRSYRHIWHEAQLPQWDSASATHIFLGSHWSCTSL